MSRIEIDKDWLIEEYCVKGMSGTKIAADLGCDHSRVYVALREFGIKAKSKSKLWKVTKEDLNKLYWDDGMSTAEIAKLYGCVDTVVGVRMKKLGVRSRTLSEAAKLAWEKGKQTLLHEPVNVTKEQLETWYHTKKMSTPEIARDLGCSSTTVKRKMGEYEISARTISDANRLTGRAGEPLGYRVEIDEDVLISQYVDGEKSLCQLAELLKCSYSTIRRRLDSLGIEPRSHEDAVALARKRLLEENLIRRDGAELVPYPVEWNNEFKDSIRNRDGYSCAVCRLFGNCVHHIDYNKRNTTTGNCITLCRSCHTTTNYHRKYWEKELHAIMVARGAA